MKRILIIFLASILMFTTACWDMADVNDRIFPYSIGIDLNTNNKKDFLVNFSYPNINAIGNESTSDIKSFIVSTEANGIFDAMENLSNRIQRPIYLKHLKVLIVSEEVAKDEHYMKGIIDGLNRDYIMNKRINLLMVKDSTKRFTEVKTNSTRQESVGGPLHELLINEQGSTKFTPKSLNMFIKDMDDISFSTIPIGMESEEKKEVLISGGAVFKDYQLIGYIDEVENRNISILNGKTKLVKIDQEFNGVNLALSMLDIKSKKKLVNKEELKIEYDIRMEGQLHEYAMEEGLNDEKSQKLIKDMELLIKESMEKDLNRTVNKLQNELRADIINVGRYLSRFHPSIWNKVKDDWEDIYPNINIKTNVEVNIRRQGLIN